MVGIIDYMRQYDIIKRMERMGKSVSMIAGQAEPTIVQPSLYKTRFQQVRGDFPQYVALRPTAILIKHVLTRVAKFGSLNVSWLRWKTTVAPSVLELSRNFLKIARLN